VQVPTRQSTHSRLDGAVGRLVSAGRLGEGLGRLSLRPEAKTARRRVFNWPPGRPPGLLAHLPGIDGKVTVAWPTVCARGLAGYAAGVSTGWNSDHLPGLREPASPVSAGGASSASPAARDRGRVECDAGPLLTAEPDDRRVLAALAPERWQRMGAVPDHPAPLRRQPGPGRCTGGTVTLRFHRSAELEPSPDIGALVREIDCDPIAVVWG
jgi:hypothetical protein